MNRLFKLLSITPFFVLSGCAVVTDHFTNQEPSTTHLGGNKHYIEFAAKNEKVAGPKLEGIAKGICKQGYDLDDYSTEFVPPFYTIVKARVSCN